MKLSFDFPKGSISQKTDFEFNCLNHENGNLDLVLKKHWFYDLDGDCKAVTALIQLQFWPNDRLSLFVKDADLQCYHLKLDSEFSIIKALVEREQFESIYNYIADILCSPVLSVIQLLSKHHREFEDKELDYFYGYIDAMFDSGFIDAEFKNRLESTAYQVHIKSIKCFSRLA